MIPRRALCAGALALLAGAAAAAPAADGGHARATLTGDVLTLSTGRMTRLFRWNHGDVIGTALIDEARGVRWTLAADRPDVALPGVAGATAGAGRFEVRRIADDGITPAHLLATIEARVGGLDVRRRCTLFEDAPAIRCVVALRGPPGVLDSREQAISTAMIESRDDKAGRAEFETDRLALPGRHWRAQTVRFEIATDHHDTLVHHDRSLLYREDQPLDGNVLSLAPADGTGQIFVLKEAPPGENQIGWPGHDFLARIGDVGVSGSGFEPSDLSPSQWTPAYGVTVGVAAPGRFALLDALRAHMETLRPYRPARDATVTSNTWGDRSRDSRMTEDFVRREIDAAAALGLTHVQLDDGWQAGTSRNSADAAGARWDAWRAEDWRPNPRRFPHGLAPLAAYARGRGVALGLWFNPSKAGDYAEWARDADILIGLWRRFGIANFKIDGVDCSSVAARKNLRAFFDRVTQATHGAVSFDVDVTAGRRPGYFALNRYGAIFLENRYTDWGNYYPYRTLRNLWMLAAYVPPQWLQIEFLNTLRNPASYPAGDRFAPARIPMTYAFGVAAAAQPLAWMELSHLTAGQRAALAPTIKAYRAVEADLHRGRIFPIGVEPDGKSWTGFQSILPGGRSGYLILYREAAAPAEGEIGTFLPAHTRIRLEPVLGDFAASTLVVGANGDIPVALPRHASFAIVRYHLLDSRSSPDR